MRKNNFFVLTGGPGSGKTTLIAEIEKYGIRCVPEVARLIIKDQLMTGGNVMPWGDRASYCDMMIRNSVRDFSRLQNEVETYIFDRGVLDTIAYMRLTNLEIPDEYMKLVDEIRCNQKVFILPPWEDIFAKDNERRQEFEEAIQTFEQIQKTYHEFSYQLIEIPKLNPWARAQFLLSHIR